MEIHVNICTSQSNKSLKKKNKKKAVGQLKLKFRLEGGLMWIEIWLGGALVFTKAMGLRVTQKTENF